MKKRVFISVTSDLVTDQRVRRAATALNEAGYEVVVVGRQLKKSSTLFEKEYQIVRFKLWFERGFLFYMTYNLRLFFFLLFQLNLITTYFHLSPFILNKSLFIWIYH